MLLLWLRTLSLLEQYINSSSKFRRPLSLIEVVLLTLETGQKELDCFFSSDITLKMVYDSVYYLTELLDVILVEVSIFLGVAQNGEINMDSDRLDLQYIEMAQS